MNPQEHISHESDQRAENQAPESPRPALDNRLKQPRRPDGCLTYRTLEQAIEVFWTRVTKAGPNECWLWQEQSRVGKGYGSLRFNKKGWRAHVFSWFIHHGSPNGLCVLHKCDNPRCVNPAHLFLGTVLDNVRDMIAKGRANKARGCDCASAKLTEEQVLEIRHRYKKGSKSSGGVALGREFGVSNTVIYWVVKGRIWKHVK